MNNQYISEAFDNLNRLYEASKTRNPIPAPFRKYFDLSVSDSEDDFQPGEEIEGYGCHFLGFLDPKEKYEDIIDIYPILTDDPNYPVVEIAGGRLFPVDIHDIVSLFESKEQ